MRTSHASIDEGTGKLVLVSRFTCRHRFLNQMWRVDRQKEEYFGRASNMSPGELPKDKMWAVAWDGNTARLCNSQSNIAAVIPQSKLNHVAMIGGPLYHEHYLSSHMGEPYVRNIRWRKNANVILGDGSMLIEAGPNKNALVSWDTQHLRVELKEVFRFMPVMIERWDDPSAKDRMLIRIENQYRRWPEDVWAPDQSTTTAQWINADGPKTISNVKMNILEAHFNVLIDPKIFTLEFPTGTVVYEAKEKKNYIAAADGKRDYEAYQKAALKNLKILAAEGEAQSPASRYVLIAFNAIALLLIGIFIWRRRSRSQAAP